jgi:hypothetical protein
VHNTQISSSHHFLNLAVTAMAGVVVEEAAASLPLGATAGAVADSSCLHLEEHPAAAVGAVVAHRQLRCLLP